MRADAGIDLGGIAAGGADENALCADFGVDLAEHAPIPVTQK